MGSTVKELKALAMKCPRKTTRNKVPETIKTEETRDEQENAVSPPEEPIQERDEEMPSVERPGKVNDGTKDHEAMEIEDDEVAPYDQEAEKVQKIAAREKAAAEQAAAEQAAAEQAAMEEAAAEQAAVEQAVAEQAAAEKATAEQEAVELRAELKKTVEEIKAAKEREETIRQRLQAVKAKIRGLNPARSYLSAAIAGLTARQVGAQNENAA
ncbi:MAG: uncharacterized protein A8A55_3237, partial [Amphiamblys sp. WSBS2006]